MVEMAVIGIGLCFAREYFYDSLLPMEQDRLIAWLNQINLYDMPKNNWRFSGFWSTSVSGKWDVPLMKND